MMTWREKPYYFLYPSFDRLLYTWWDWYGFVLIICRLWYSPQRIRWYACGQFFSRDIVQYISFAEKKWLGRSYCKCPICSFLFRLIMVFRSTFKVPAHYSVLFAAEIKLQKRVLNSNKLFPSKLDSIQIPFNQANQCRLGCKAWNVPKWIFQFLFRKSLTGFPFPAISPQYLATVKNQRGSLG